MIEAYQPSLSEIVRDVPLNAAETYLIEMCKTGEITSFGNDRPTLGNDQNNIRAELIRHILLGGCDKVLVHAKGVQIQGAWITGFLDLQACEISLDLNLVNCHICEAPNLKDARLESVMLPGCWVRGIEAPRLKVVRDIWLTKGFESIGTVNLNRAKIGGALDCKHGTFDGEGEFALYCDAMKVGGSVSMCCEIVPKGDVPKRFVAKGDVMLRAVEVVKHISFMGSKFEGAGEVTLDCAAMAVGGEMYWRDVIVTPDKIDLAYAHVGTLLDDAASWRGCLLVLNGFRYDRIISDVSLRERLAWLGTAYTEMIERGARGRWFVRKPVPDTNAQPYTQFARVLDGQGYWRDAAVVRFERENGCAGRRMRSGWWWRRRQKQAGCRRPVRDSDSLWMECLGLCLGMAIARCGPCCGSRRFGHFVLCSTVRPLMRGRWHLIRMWF